MIECYEVAWTNETGWRGSMFFAREDEAKKQAERQRIIGMIDITITPLEKWPVGRSRQGTTHPTSPKMTIEMWRAESGKWECPECRVRIVSVDGNARWNGEAWEHRCDGMDPQVGYIQAVRIVTDSNCLTR